MVKMELRELQDQLSKLSETEIMENLRARRPIPVAEPDLKPSAVIIPLIRTSQGWCALFTKRSQNVKAHKGEISFPGGIIESGESALGAALRELEEELGIKRERLRILGELDEILTITGFRIRPFVASLEWPQALKPNQEEIEKVYILALSRFLEPEIFKVQQSQRKGENYPIYFFQLPECTVWGATAKILKNLLERLLGEWKVDRG